MGLNVAGYQSHLAHLFPVPAFNFLSRRKFSPLTPRQPMVEKKNEPTKPAMHSYSCTVKVNSAHVRGNPLIIPLGQSFQQRSRNTRLGSIIILVCLDKAYWWTFMYMLLVLSDPPFALLTRFWPMYYYYALKYKSTAVFSEYYLYVLQLYSRARVCMYVCMVITYSRVWINRVRLPILLVVRWTGKINIPLSPCVPENLVSRDGFSRPVPRQPPHLHTQAESGAYGIPPGFRGGVQLWNCHTSSDQSRVYRVTQLRTDGVHCREFAGTGPE